MQSILHILELWTLAFVTLCLALGLLNVFFSLIDNDLTLNGLGREIAIAAVASLIEGVSVWVVVTFIPRGGRALFIPALVVGVIYKAAHFEDWSRYEVVALLFFQAVVTAFGACLFLGHFSTAFAILLMFFICLAVVFAFTKGL